MLAGWLVEALEVEDAVADGTKELLLESLEAFACTVPKQWVGLYIEFFRDLSGHFFGSCWRHLAHNKRGILNCQLLLLCTALGRLLFLRFFGLS